MARQFGIITVPAGTITAMVANSVSSSTSVETATARNESGKVINNQAYSKTTTLTVRGLLDAASPTVVAGSTIVISGGTFLVTSAELSESNTAFVEYSLTAVSIDGCTPTPYA